MHNQNLICGMSFERLGRTGHACYLKPRRQGDSIYRPQSPIQGLGLTYLGAYVGRLVSTDVSNHDGHAVHNNRAQRRGGFRASSTYYNYALNHDAEWAGETQVVSTVASLASEYAEASSSSSSATASSSEAAASSSAAVASSTEAAAVPSAGCWILEDSGIGGSLFEIYGINDWAGEDGDSLLEEESGCGAITDWMFDTDETSEFEGKGRDMQTAIFSLSFFKDGCVERAVHSAGGPEPGGGDDQIACEHGPPSDYED